MAGDWIKMRVDLGDDPAVVQMAAQLDITEDEVVGKLHRLWSWADKHTTDGTAPAITAKWVDRYVSRPGFAGAMEAAHWISFSESGVAFPQFDRHNGDSAKRRVEATLRQRLSRKNRDDGVTGDERTSIPRPFVRHVMQRDGYRCVFCGDQSDEKTESGRKARMSVDHLKPIKRGGSAAVDNLACACRQCNNEKNDRTPEEWGLIPTFLSPGVSYSDGSMIENESQFSCDKSVTREEKRREEKKENLISVVNEGESVASASHPPAGKATRLPAGWILPKAWGEWALTDQPSWTPDVVRRVADQFRDHWFAQGGAGARKVDWSAAWRNWVRREKPAGVAARAGGTGLNRQEALEASNRAIAAELTREFANAHQ